jgi:small-conductance mechanosensitive channel
VARGSGLILAKWARRRRSALRSLEAKQRNAIVNSIIWLVGAVVIVLFILGYFGLA